MAKASAAKKAPRDGKYVLNEFQKAAAGAYEGGDFRYFGTDPEYTEFKDYAAFRKALDDISDGLFTFIMVELGSPHDEVDAETAHDRIARAIDQLHEVVNKLAFMTVEDAPAPKM